MTREETLVEITTMPSIKSAILMKDDKTLFAKNQGIIVKGWEHWSDTLECNIQYLDILTNGQLVQYWRPEIESHKPEFDWGDPGFWEISGNGSQSFEIYPVQMQTHK